MATSGRLLIVSMGGWKWREAHTHREWMDIDSSALQIQFNRGSCNLRAETCRQAAPGLIQFGVDARDDKCQWHSGGKLIAASAGVRGRPNN